MVKPGEPALVARYSCSYYMKQNVSLSDARLPTKATVQATHNELQPRLVALREKLPTLHTLLVYSDVF